MMMAVIKTMMMMMRQAACCCRCRSVVVARRLISVVLLPLLLLLLPLCLACLPASPLAKCPPPRARLRHYCHLHSLARSFACEPAAITNSRESQILFVVLVDCCHRCHINTVNLCVMFCVCVCVVSPLAITKPTKLHPHFFFFFFSFSRFPFQSAKVPMGQS